MFLKRLQHKANNSDNNNDDDDDNELDSDGDIEMNEDLIEVPNDLNIDEKKDDIDEEVLNLIPDQLVGQSITHPLQIEAQLQRQFSAFEDVLDDYTITEIKYYDNNFSTLMTDDNKCTFINKEHDNNELNTYLVCNHTTGKLYIKCRQCKNQFRLLKNLYVIKKLRDFEIAEWLVNFTKNKFVAVSSDDKKQNSILYYKLPGQCYREDRGWTYIKKFIYKKFRPIALKQLDNLKRQQDDPKVVAFLNDCKDTLDRKLGDYSAMSSVIKAFVSLVTRNDIEWNTNISWDYFVSCYVLYDLETEQKRDLKADEFINDQRNCMRPWTTRETEAENIQTLKDDYFPMWFNNQGHQDTTLKGMSLGSRDHPHKFSIGNVGLNGDNAKSTVSNLGREAFRGTLYVNI